MKFRVERSKLYTVFLEMVKEYKLSPTQITVEILEEVYTSSEEMKK